MTTVNREAFFLELVILMDLFRVEWLPVTQAAFYEALEHLPENYVLDVLRAARRWEYMPKPFDLIQAVKVMERNDLKMLPPRVFNPTPAEAAEIVSGIQEHLRSLDERSRQRPGPTSLPTR